jgi:hypothetical protein
MDLVEVAVKSINIPNHGECHWRMCVTRYLSAMVIVQRQVWCGVNAGSTCIYTSDWH